MLAPNQNIGTVTKRKIPTKMIHTNRPCEAPHNENIHNVGILRNKFWLILRLQFGSNQIEQGSRQLIVACGDLFFAFVPNEINGSFQIPFYKAYNGLGILQS